MIKGRGGKKEFEWVYTGNIMHSKVQRELSRLVESQRFFCKSRQKATRGLRIRKNSGNAKKKRGLASQARKGQLPTGTKAGHIARTLEQFKGKMITLQQKGGGLPPEKRMRGRSSNASTRSRPKAREYYLSKESFVKRYRSRGARMGGGEPMSMKKERNLGSHLGGTERDDKPRREKARGKEVHTFRGKDGSGAKG